MTNPLFPGQSFFHGTKANFKQGDLVKAGYNSNYGKRAAADYVYLSGTLNAAIWGAELALGEGAGRIYVVEPTGAMEDDPDLTDKKYPGNPTLSYRCKDPLRVIGEVVGWQGHSSEELENMKKNVERARQRSSEPVEGSMDKCL